MEKSVEYGLEHYIAEIPGMAQADPRSVSPLVLAYIGDCTRRQAVMCRLHPSRI